MIAIVGAGLTGLALSRELHRSGVEHLVLEASERPGGVVHSGRVEGHLLEWGPQRARLTADFRALVEELGLESQLLTAPPGLPLYVYSRGRLRRVPFSASEFLRTDLLTTRAKARLLLEPLTSAVRKEESVAEAFTRKLGREAYESLAGPLYGGLYASDPADMLVGLSLDQALRQLGIGRSLIFPLLRRGGRIDPPPAVSFQEGLQTLTDALHLRVAEHIHLGEAVTGLRRQNDGLLLKTTRRELSPTRVVLTTPAPVTSELLGAVDAEAAGRIGRLRYNPLAVVHLSSPADLHGLGYQVGLGERLLTRGVTFNHAMFGRTSVFTVYLGGARAPQVVDWTDEEIAAAAMREFRLVTGSDSSVLSVARVAMPAWDASWRAIADLRIPAEVAIAANWWSRPGIPGRLAEARRLARELTG